MTFWKWSKTELDNDDADASINWAEFQNPDTVNNSARAMMARIAEFAEDLGPNRTSTGSVVNEYAATSEAAPADLTNPFHVFFIAHQDCTGASTLQVNALARKPIRAKTATSLSDGDIKAGTVVGAYWNPTGDEYLITNSGFYVNALGPEISAGQQTTLKVGDPVISFASEPLPGRIRLGETPTAFVEAERPELSQWLAKQGYPWGRDTGAGTANLPRAAGYFLRIIGTSTSIDTGGARDPGEVQNDLIKAHGHGAGDLTGSTSRAGGAPHSFQLRRATISEGGSGSRTVYVTNGGSLGTITTDPANDHQHSLNVSGTTADSGGAETRPKNIGVHLDIIASAQEANSDVYGVNGVPYKWDTGVADADPGNGRIRADNADLTAATEIYISTTGANGEALQSWIETFDDSGTALRGHLHVYQIGAPSKYAIFAVNGPVLTATGYCTLDVSYVSGSTTLPDGKSLGVLFYRSGLKGDSGTDAGLRWEFSTSTTIADPGAGGVRFNNADRALATQIAFSSQVSDTGNPDVHDFLAAWDDSTSSIKGSLLVRSTENPERFALYDITGLSDSTTWLTVDVTYRDGSATAFTASEVISFSHSRTGDKGDTGATVVSTSVGTVTTLAAGASATVSNSGTSTAAIFDFGIPAGADGADGVDGSDGAPGANGADGADGIFLGTETTLTSIDDADLISFQDVDDGDNVKRITKANFVSGLGGSVFTPYASRAILKQSSAQSCPTSPTQTTLSWQTEVEDIGGWFSTGAPTRLTVPSGIAAVFITADLKLSGAAGSNGTIQIEHYNSSSVLQTTYLDGFNYNSLYAGGTAKGPIAVSAGDYFTLVVIQNSGSARFTNTSICTFSIAGVA